mmetsp:Transcript_16308/g.48909  ORF Transcript_16308/g.48909 Transcript_16308/m.48909 type:complete len:388 (+) Transcript_16308:465-1628(+)
MPSYAFTALACMYNPRCDKRSGMTLQSCLCHLHGCSGHVDAGAPAVLLVFLEPLLAHHAVCFWGATRACGVFEGWMLVVVNGMQQWREDGPRRRQLIPAHKVLLVPVNCIQQQPLVSLGNVLIMVPHLVRQVQFAHDGCVVESGLLHCQLHVNCLAGLEAHDQLVAHLVQLHIAARQRHRRLELHADLHLPLVQRLAGLQDERHPRPAVILDVQHAHGEGGSDRVLGDPFVIQIPWHTVARRVLPQHTVLHCDRGDGPQHLHLLIPDVIGTQADRLLHGNERHDLNQVILDDIPNDAELVKVAAPPLRAKRLLEANLHVGNVVAVPAGGNNGIGEPQHDQVLCQLLAQVVVDPENLLLRPILCNLLRKVLRRLQVFPEGLLHNDSKP